METNTKAAMIAAVTEALKYKEKNPSAKDAEVFKHVVRVADEIIARMSS